MPKLRPKSTLPVREYLDIVELIRALNMDILTIYTSTRVDEYNNRPSKAFTDALTASAKNLAKRLEALLDI